MTLTISLRRRGHVQFAARDLVTGDRARQRARDDLAESVEALVHDSVSRPQRSIVPVRRIFFCSSSTP